MENQPQQQQQTGLCRSGCGFYGSPVTEGLCSKCFKDSIKRTQDTTMARSMGQNSNSTLSDVVIRDTMDASTSMDVSPVVSANIAATELEIADIAADTVTTAEKQIADEVSMNLGVNTARGSSASLSSTSSSLSFNDAAGASTDGAPPPSKKPNRCHMCKKRVGLTGFTCRCGGLYCGEHRYDTAHNCAFDYKTMEREEIRKNNPVVVSDKIQRI